MIDTRARGSRIALFFRAISIVGAIAGISLVSLPEEVASADAIEPPPSSCPGDQVPVSDHGGPRCMDPAPSDCPSGWRGALGWTCVLAECSTDAECRDWKTCQPADLCVVDEGSAAGQPTATATSSSSSSSPLAPTPKDSPRTHGGSMIFAGPRYIPPHLDVAYDVCGQGSSCDAPAACKSGHKLCLAPGARAALKRDIPATITAGARSTHAGCATTPVRVACGGFALAALVGLAYAVRRATKKKQ